MDDPKWVIKLTAECNGATAERVVRIEKCDLDTFKNKLREASDQLVADVLDHIS